MTAVRIRTPEPGETPLSLDEQRFADEHGIRPKRFYPKHFAWREPAAHPAPARAYGGPHPARASQEARP